MKLRLKIRVKHGRGSCVLGLLCFLTGCLQHVQRQTDSIKFQDIPEENITLSVREAEVLDVPKAQRAERDHRPHHGLPSEVLGRSRIRHSRLMESQRKSLLGF